MLMVDVDMIRGRMIKMASFFSGRSLFIYINISLVPDHINDFYSLFIDTFNN